MQKKGQIDNKKRSDMVCKIDPTYRIDFGKWLQMTVFKKSFVQNGRVSLHVNYYEIWRESISQRTSELTIACLSSVYKVRVEKFEEELPNDVYTMMLLEVIKEGGYLSLNCSLSSTH